MNKRTTDGRYKGETTYFGRSRSGHQVVLYDKGYQKFEKRNDWIRIESRLRFVGKERPLVSDFLNGKWQPEAPFRKTMLIDSEQLPLRSQKKSLDHFNEKSSLTKKGLTRFFKDLKPKRRQVLYEHAKKNVILDFNEEFKLWFQTWVSAEEERLDFPL